MKTQTFPKAYIKVTDKVALNILIDYLMYHKRPSIHSEVRSLISNKVYKYGRKLINSIYIESFSEGYYLRFFNQKDFMETNEIIVYYTIYNWRIVKETIKRLKILKESS